MDKFKVNCCGKSNGYKPVIIDVSAYDKLAQIKEITGIPLTKLLSQMVDFCAERLEVED